MFVAFPILWAMPQFATPAIVADATATASLITALGAMSVAVIGAATTVWTSRRKAREERAAAEAAAHAERMAAEATAEVDHVREAQDALVGTIRMLREDATVMHGEIAELRRQLAECRRTCDELKREQRKR